MPSDFPLELKYLISMGWSKEPKERPSAEEFKSALNKMLAGKEKEDNTPAHEFLRSKEKNSSNDTKEQRRTQEVVKPAQLNNPPMEMPRIQQSEAAFNPRNTFADNLSNFVDFLIILQF